MIEIDELFISVMSCRRYHSQMFLKIDVLRNFARFTRNNLFWSLFLIKFQAKFLKTRSFTEYLQWLFLWFLQQNKLIFSVITITLGYIKTKNCHGNTVIIITLSIQKCPSPIKRMPIWPKDFVAFPTFFSQVQTS